MGRIQPQIFLLFILAGCSSLPGDATSDRIDAAQRAAKFGSTADWKISDANWSKNTRAMRDRAYRFCIERYEANTKCFDEQDYSLIAANHSETNARRAIVKESGYLPFDSIRSRPEAFDEARRYCFSIYQDAGAADARMLGPCLSNATGSDFFSIIPVS
ncbi:hypothetical protein [Sphingomonas sp. Leaf4]|uniref:hypothetical protein n=1 Tax=Sphingomonas sp. Leaf4 TaxID=2876553 RepID=UPI001E2B1D43|nr:hypothetical protein [Sphingomonas sp. Leaf4]